MESSLKYNFIFFIASQLFSKLLLILEISIQVQNLPWSRIPFYKNDSFIHLVGHRVRV